MYEICLLATGFLCLATTIFGKPAMVEAPTPVPVTGWSEPVNLSGWIDDKSGPWYPRIAADAAGGIHIIWDGWVGQPPGIVQGSNAILYTRWDGTRWTEPIDVLTSEADEAVAAGDIQATQDGRLAVAWASAGSTYLSEAPVEEAADARAWETRRLGSGSDPKLAFDEPEGRWYVTLVDGGNIRLLASTDGGSTWASDEVLWAAPAKSIAASNGGLVVASDGSLNAAWSEHDGAKAWAGVAIWHARQQGGIDAAPQVRKVAGRTAVDDPSLDSPTLAAGPDGVLHLFWNNGVGSLTGRFHQWSPDNGATWSETEAVFPGLSGQTRQAGLLLDGGGTLRLITAADGFGYTFGVVRYASWREGKWDEFTTLWPEQYPGEFPATALTDGNRLHVVWNGLRGRPDGGVDRSIVYSSLRLDAPLKAPSGFAERAAKASQPLSATSTPATNQASPEPVQSPTATPTRTVDPTEAPPADVPPLLLSVLPAVVLVGAAVILTMIRRRRRS
jgi:hypothetical protein